MDEVSFLFTSESVNEGHPDKVRERARRRALRARG